MLKPVAQKADPSCLGRHQDLRTHECQVCLLKLECGVLMGPESTGTRLSEYRWDFLPAGYRKCITSARDLENAYYTAHQTIFGRPPKDRLGRLREVVVAAAAQVPCSVRLYLLTCMIAWSEREELLVDTEQKAQPSPFGLKVLTQPLGLQWANRYLRLCRRTYGSEDLSSLDKIVDGNFDKSDLYRRFLDSEIAAGRFIVAWKFRYEGLPWTALYAKLETALDPEWLAIEKTFRPILYGPNLTRFRHLISRRHGFLKKHPRAAIAVFRCREDVFPQAVDRVLADYGLKPSDFFLHDDVVFTPLQFWVWLGKTIQHLEMVRAQNGQASRFSSMVEHVAV